MKNGQKLMRIVIALALLTFGSLAALRFFRHWHEDRARPFEALDEGVPRHEVHRILGSPKESLRNSMEVREAAVDWNLLCCETGARIPSNIGVLDRELRYYDEVAEELRALPEVELYADFYWAAPLLGFLIYYDPQDRVSRVLRCAP